MNSGFARCRSRPGMTNKRASLPVFFERRRVRRIPILTAALEKYRGRAGRQGPDGPADLDASRHRGLSKSDSAASPPFPWRPARGVSGLLRLAPGGLPVSGGPPFLSNWKVRLSTAVGPGGAWQPMTGCRPRRHGGPATRGWRAGTKRLGPLGLRAASPTRRNSPATAPRPASGDADQTPLGHEGRDT